MARQTTPQTRSQESSWSWRKVLPRDLGFVRLLLITVGIFATMSLLRPEQFYTLTNIRSMAFQFPEIALLSLAMMLSMLTAGIDLSVVGVANLAAILSALFMGSAVSSGLAPGLTIFLGITLALAVGLVAGVINGLLIAKINIPPILATLGTSQVFVGIGLGITGGRAVLGLPGAYSVVGNGTFLGLPVPFHHLCRVRDISRYRPEPHDLRGEGLPVRHQPARLALRGARERLDYRADLPLLRLSLVCRGADYDVQGKLCQGGLWSVVPAVSGAYSRVGRGEPLRGFR